MQLVFQQESLSPVVDGLLAEVFVMRQEQPPPKTIPDQVTLAITTCNSVDIFSSNKLIHSFACTPSISSFGNRILQILSELQVVSSWAGDTTQATHRSRSTCYTASSLVKAMVMLPDIGERWNTMYQATSRSKGKKRSKTNGCGRIVLRTPMEPSSAHVKNAEAHCRQSIPTPCSTQTNSNRKLSRLTRKTRRSMMKESKTMLQEDKMLVDATDTDIVLRGKALPHWLSGRPVSDVLKICHLAGIDEAHVICLFLPDLTETHITRRWRRLRNRSHINTQSWSRSDDRKLSDAVVNLLSNSGKMDWEAMALDHCKGGADVLRLRWEMVRSRTVGLPTPPTRFSHLCDLPTWTDDEIKLWMKLRRQGHDLLQISKQLPRHDRQALHGFHTECAQTCGLTNKQLQLENRSRTQIPLKLPGQLALHLVAPWRSPGQFHQPGLLHSYRMPMTNKARHIILQVAYSATHSQQSSEYELASDVDDALSSAQNNNRKIQQSSKGPANSTVFKAARTTETHHGEATAPRDVDSGYGSDDETERYRFSLAEFPELSPRSTTKGFSRSPNEPWNSGPPKIYQDFEASWKSSEIDITTEKISLSGEDDQNPHLLIEQSVDDKLGVDARNSFWYSFSFVMGKMLNVMRSSSHSVTPFTGLWK